MRDVEVSWRIILGLVHPTIIVHDVCISARAIAFVHDSMISGDVSLVKHPGALKSIMNDRGK